MDHGPLFSMISTSIFRRLNEVIMVKQLNQLTEKLSFLFQNLIDLYQKNELFWKFES